MALNADKRECPFCGTTLVLGALPVVATNRYTIEDADERENTMPSGRPILWWDEARERFPVLVAPPLEGQTRGSLVKRVHPRNLKPLKPVTDVAGREDLPARLCTVCHWPLPQNIDDRRVFTIAVVGTGASGKTHFLTSALRDAYRYQMLEPFSCDEFMPEEETAQRYDNDFYAPLFEDNQVLYATSVESEVRFRPLTFKVTFEDCKPALVMFHDVSGETLMNRGERASTASFVQRADAVIFLVDPEASRAFRPANSLRPPNQAAMMSGCVDDLDRKRRATVPVAVALSKSDIVASALPQRRYTFAAQPPADPAKWSREFRAIDQEVRGVLSEFDMHDLVVATKPLERVSFHAVAPIGLPADDLAAGREPRPLRNLEPLMRVLGQIPGLAS